MKLLRTLANKINAKQLLFLVCKFLGYFTLLMALSMPSGWNTHYICFGGQSFTPCATLSEMENTRPGCDQASYARLARDMASGRFDQVDHGVLAVFTPGISFCEAVLVQLFGWNTPIVFWLMVCNAAVWSLVFLKLQELALEQMSQPVAFLLPFSICLGDIFRRYFLHGGVVMSEPLGIGCLSLAILYLVRSAKNQNLREAFLSGIFLACAAYFRAQIELFVMCLTMLTIASVGYTIFFVAPKKLEMRGNVLGCLKERTKNFFSQKNGATTLVIAIVVFNCFTLPYRVWKLIEYQSPAWLQADYHFRMGWIRAGFDENEYQKGWVTTGATIPALIDPELAARIKETIGAHGENALSDNFFKWRTLSTFLRHPVKWLALKATIFPGFWFEAPFHPDSAYPGHGRSSAIGILENILYALLIGFASFRLVVVPLLRKRIWGPECSYFFVYSALLLSNLATFIFMHFEGRYSYMIKFVTLIIVPAFWFTRKNRTSLLNLPNVTSHRPEMAVR